MLIALFSSFIQGAPSKATPTEYDFVVRVALKDLWKSSNINGLQAASKAFILK